jgi:hypothetical protein
MITTPAPTNRAPITTPPVAQTIPNEVNMLAIMGNRIDDSTISIIIPTGELIF